MKTTADLDRPGTAAQPRAAPVRARRPRGPALATAGAPAAIHDQELT
ncbi:hypothetical protein ABZV14_22395 [Streptosporangium canum]